MTYPQLKAEALVALQSAMAGQSYTVNGVTYTRQNVSALQELIDWLDKQIAKDAAGANASGEIIVKI